MRIGVAAGSGIRGYVLADVLRRYAELRGATAWVVAPSLGGLSRLNVAPPAMETGPVDVMVSVAKTVGVAPADDLAARLVLLASPPQVPVSLTPTALTAAQRRLGDWRRTVARWAEQPSGPMVRSYPARAFAALKESWDTAAVVALLDELCDEVGASPGSRFETAAYLDRILALDLVADVGRPS